MGTVSLIVGLGCMIVGFALIGHGVLGSYVILNLMFGLPFVVVGAIFLVKYDRDRKKGR